MHPSPATLRARLMACAGTGLALAALAIQSADAKGLLIGFSQATLQSPFYVQLKNGAEAAAKADGDQIVVLDANGDVNKQNNDIQDLITKGVKVLVVNPVNPDAVGPALSAASDAHIPLLTVDRTVHEGAVTYVGRNNEHMGALVGQAMVAHFGNHAAGVKIIEIQGDAGGTVMMARRDGFNRVVQAAGMKVVLGPYAEYVRSNAVTAMQDLLQSNPDVKAVYAHNDDMALGALQVLRENNRNDVVVAGVDGLSEAVKDIAGGDQYIASALNDPVKLAEVTVHTAQQVAAGQKEPAFIDAGTAAITKQNVSDFSTDGLFARRR